MSGRWCMPISDGMRLAFHVTPNARKTEIVGVTGDALKIKLQAPPVDGKANDALVKYVADRLRVSRSSVQITHGQTNRRKLIEVRTSGLTADIVSQVFGV